MSRFIKAAIYAAISLVGLVLLEVCLSILTPKTFCVIVFLAEMMAASLFVSGGPMSVWIAIRIFIAERSLTVITRILDIEMINVIDSHGMFFGGLFCFLAFTPFYVLVVIFYDKVFLNRGEDPLFIGWYREFMTRKEAAPPFPRVTHLMVGPGPVVLMSSLGLIPDIFLINWMVGIAIWVKDLVGWASRATFRSRVTVFLIGSVFVADPDIVALLLRKEGESATRVIFRVLIPATLYMSPIWAVLYGWLLEVIEKFGWYRYQGIACDILVKIYTF
jgi:hypothetical protein